MGKLTDKQERFCAEYMKDLNATQAAIRAGYSEKTATVIGYENLTKPHIQSKIEALKKIRAQENKVDADWVLQRWKEIAEADLLSFFNDEEDGFVLKSIKELPKELRKYVTKIKTVSGGMQIEFVSKEMALKMIGEHVDFSKQITREEKTWKMEFVDNEGD